MARVPQPVLNGFDHGWLSHLSCWTFLCLTVLVLHPDGEL